MRCFPFPDGNSRLLKHSTTMADNGQIPKKDHFS